jgi:hypothetical protein
MAKISAKGAVITVGGTSIATYCKTYEIEWAQDVPEVTGFGDGWRNYLAAGMPVVGITLDMMWESTVTTGPYALMKSLMTTPATVVITPESGAPSLSGTFMCDGIHPSGAASAGEIGLGSVHLSPSGATIATFTS